MPLFSNRKKVQLLIFDNKKQKQWFIFSIMLLNIDSISMQYSTQYNQFYFRKVQIDNVINI